MHEKEAVSDVDAIANDAIIGAGRKPRPSNNARLAPPTKDVVYENTKAWKVIYFSSQSLFIELFGNNTVQPKHFLCWSFRPSGNELNAMYLRMPIVDHRTRPESSKIRIGIELT
jgi:hypothetical protein